MVTSLDTAFSEIVTHDSVRALAQSIAERFGRYVVDTFETDSVSGKGVLTISRKENGRDPRDPTAFPYCLPESPDLLRDRIVNHLRIEDTRRIK